MARILPLCALLAVWLQAAAAGLSWPDAYTAMGHIYLPYADIAEPFTAYVSMKTMKSRMDTYNGTARIINRGDVGDYGMVYKIVPETTNDFVNRITCFKISGGEGAKVMPQGVLPNASLYEYVADYTYNGIPSEVYLSSFTEGKKENNYTLLVRKDNQMPLVLRFVGYDRLFGSHYDEYVLVYESFSAGEPNPEVFDYQQKFECIGFPGPGVASPMSENPFFELIGAGGYSRNDQSKEVDGKFEHFKKHHGKNYKDEADEGQRKTYFRHNHRYIKSMNRRDLGYKLAVNHLADYSSAEMKRMRGYRTDKTSPRGEVYQSKIKNLEDVPDSADWWIKGAVTPVKDQAICGSCWSFGTTGTIEGSLFIKTGKLVSLSEQVLMDCSWGYGNNACDGGESERAYRWIIHFGCIPTEDSYGQYLMQDGFCHANESVCGTSITKYYNTISGNTTDLVIAIFEHGPISVAIDASHLSFSFYGNGVYYEPECGSGPDSLDHQVLAVGYGTMDGHDYWLIKNSWSTHWGMDGYVLMSRKNNNCGVATDASFAEIA